MEFEQIYFDLKLKFQDKIDAIDAFCSINVSGQNISIAIPTEQSNANFRLRKLNIPVFSGKFEDWINFKDLFVTAVHSQTSLGNLQKFQYLKGLLSDEPASLIKHIPLSNKSYEEVWGKLIDRYDKKKQIAYPLIKTFLDQKGISQRVVDEDFPKPSECDVILGSDCFFSILRNGRITGSKGQPIAKSTIFGWVVAGVGQILQPDNFTLLLWLQKLNWDDALPEPFVLKWKKFQMEFQQVCHLSIPRRLQITNKKVTLYGFSDASEAAYACVVYAVQRNRETTKVVMLGGKSKVAPLKPICFPRLDLNGALLLARFFETLCNCLNDHVINIYAWTDSQVVLSLGYHPLQETGSCLSPIGHMEF
ncbi:uncharacterized protein TNCV_2801201 [Trichonephila clavipes]|nr:uncharacterized protein TNCV_2801201 [Trichonephila clavipes]